MRIRTAWVLVVLSGLAAAQGPSWGTVSGDKVRVRGGPADFHSVLGLVKQGTPVRVVGADGDWKKVEVPGGFPVYVSLGKKSRPYLEEKDSRKGEGLVVVNDLMIRGTASTDFPPIGRLGAGDRVVILSRQGAWARIASPPAAGSCIHGKYVATASDAAATEAAWTAQHETSRIALLNEGENSKALLARQEMQSKRDAAAKAAFARFKTELDKPWDARDILGMRSELVAVRDSYPQGNGQRMRAASMLTTVDEWDRAGSALRAAKKKLADAEAAAAAADKRVSADMRRIQTELEKQGQASNPKVDSPARGTVARVFPVKGLRKGPRWGIALGRRTIYRLSGDRYDWSDYEGKLIVVLKSTPAPEQIGVTEPILDVRRIEILDG